MSIRLKMFLVLLILLFIVYIIFRVKSNKLNLKYSLLWLFTGLFMLLCVFSEKLLSSIAGFIGIETTSNMIFLFGFIILIILTFALTNIVSMQKKKIITLVQEVGILKKELRGKNND